MPYTAYFLERRCSPETSSKAEQLSSWQLWSREVAWKFRAAFLTSLNWMLTTVGYIMKNSKIPIGMDNWANFRDSINCPNVGINLPTNGPATMQIAIHKVRYFSQRPKDSSFSTCSAGVSKSLILLAAGYVFVSLFCKSVQKPRS